MERLPVPAEAILVARDALSTARHSAAVTKALFDEGVRGEEASGRWPGRYLRSSEQLADSAIGAASSLARSFLPRQMAETLKLGEPWRDLMLCATKPDAGNAYRFALAAHAALSRYFRSHADSRALIAEYRLFAAYAAAAEESPAGSDRLDFLSRLVVRLHRSNIVIDIRRRVPLRRGASAEQQTAEGVFALGLWMAGSLGGMEPDPAELFNSSADLSQALRGEILPAMDDAGSVRALLEQYREHL